MSTGRQNRRNRLRLLGGLFGSALILTVAPMVARAATTTVSCTGSGDIPRVQSAVDAAANGDIIALSGTCDFTAAAPHGGSLTSVDATAVLIRPGSPVTNLSIVSAGAPQSAAIVGSGTQTAFTVAPGNTGVTIRGLRFINLARPVVVAGADGATIGSAGGLPNANANRIIGQATMNSAILAVATSDPMTVAYGAVGSGTTATFTASALRNLTVQGNYISYAPPGIGSGSAAQVVAIDVRQKGTAVVDGVDVIENAVGMFTSDFAMYTQNAVRVEGLTAVPSGATPVAADYRISNVEVRGNNFGRFEELDTGTVPGFRPGDAHAAGRAGVVIERVRDFSVTDNMVRARLSTTGGPVPGGGIVTSDSSFGRIAGNSVLVLADPTTTTSDLGAVGVLDGVPTLFGDTSADQGSYSIEVTDNSVGLPDANAGVGAQRGLVVNGAEKVTVHDNNVRTSSDDALHIGAVIRGPGALATTGAELSRTTGRAVACSNLLDGEEDDAAEVSFAPATPASSANAFPTGSAVGFPSNFECKPELAVNPTHLVSGNSVTASGRSWASRTVTITVKDITNGLLTKSMTTGADGSYSVTFTPSEIGTLTDGVLGITATAFDDSGFTLTSSERTATKDFVIDNPLAGSVRIEDGDGYTSNTDVFMQIPAAWDKPSDPRVVSATVWFANADSTIPDGCGPYPNLPPAGTGFLNQTCGNNLADGVYTFNARWTASDGETSPVVSDTSIKDTFSPKPIIVSPAQNSTVSTNNVVISGTSEPNCTILVRTLNIVLGTTSSDGAGNWSATIPLEDGTQEINVYARDVAGNRSVASDIRRFGVNSTVVPTEPPAAPDWRSPTAGSLVRSQFNIVGFSDPDVGIRVYEGPTLVGVGGADNFGNFKAEVNLPDGMHTMVVRAVNTSGDESTDSAPLTLDVDAVAPTATFVSPASRSENNTYLLEDGTVTFTGTASDDHGVAAIIVEYYDGTIDTSRKVAEQVATCTGCIGPSATWSTRVPDTMLPGFYYAVIRSFDVVGNPSGYDWVRFAKIA